MREIVELVMEREGMSYEEAKSLVIETRREIRRAVLDGCWEDAEIILADELGLEPDYISALM